MRLLVIAFMAHFAVVLFAPGWIVADFMWERGRIERELCVQRMVPEDMRTCHGECLLSKRLVRWDQRAENLPNELKAVRLCEMLPCTCGVKLERPDGGNELHWGAREEDLLEGHVKVLAPVPWC